MGGVLKGSLGDWDENRLRSYESTHLPATDNPAPHQKEDSPVNTPRLPAILRIPSFHACPKRTS